VIFTGNICIWCPGLSRFSITHLSLKLLPLGAAITAVVRSFCSSSAVCSILLINRSVAFSDLTLLVELRKSICPVKNIE